MTAPRFGSVNLVVVDVDALARFLETLGVELEPTAPEWAEWDVHHRAVRVGGPVDADLDSTAFARWWGGVPDDVAPGVVVNLRVDARGEVDRLHARAIELGAHELKAPWDAFWGARYSVVLAPGPLCIGFMSEPDDAKRTPSPSISDLA